MANSSNQANVIVGAVVLLAITAGAFDTFRKDFAEHLGFWGGVFAGTAVSSLVVFVACLAFKHGWQRSLGLAILFPATLNSFAVTKEVTSASMGGFVSLIVSCFVAVLIGGSLGVVLTRLLRISFEDSGADRSQT
jgi:hypothetical protein